MTYIALQPLGELLADALQNVLVYLPSLLQTWIEEAADSSTSSDTLLNRIYARSFRSTVSTHGFSVEATVVLFEDLIVGWDTLPIELSKSGKVSYARSPAV